MPSVAVVWHMHQPPYRDPESGLVEMPWVRLHALKDYSKMAIVAGRHPAVKLNFNFTPCLLEQVQALAAGTGSEEFLRVCRKDAQTLSKEERTILIRFGMSANPEKMVKPYPRFAALWSRTRSDPQGLTVHEIRDLQVWSNLVWTEPSFVPTALAAGHGEAGPSDGLGVAELTRGTLRDLAAKGWGFTERDKTVLFDAQQALLETVLPAYRKLAESGQVELITSPFFHPILPLVCDLGNARRANSGNQLGPIEFKRPDHAREQLRRGIELFRAIFGFSPAGIWSPEMSLSDESLEVLHEAGVGWTLGNSDLLAKTLVSGAGGAESGGSDLSVYSCRGVNVLFRDREISDRIGFVYSNWDSVDAARDLVQRIKWRTRGASSADIELLVIALDGENAWEYYPEGGWIFLDRFYDLLTEAGIGTVTISEFVKTAERGRTVHELAGIAPGSWIDSDFEVWAGSKPHQEAWSLMAGAAAELKDEPKALDHLLAAECSDWYWWLSDRYRNPEARHFNDLFKSHLRMAYKSAGKEPPGAVASGEGLVAGGFVD